MPWLVIYTNVRQERLVCSQLQRAGFEFYLTERRRRLHRQGRREIVLCPVYPRYIFLKAHPLFGIVHAFTGVVGFLRHEEIPLGVRDEVIEEIRQRQLAGEFDEKTEPKKRKKVARSFDELKMLQSFIDNRVAA